MNFYCSLTDKYKIAGILVLFILLCCSNLLYSQKKVKQIVHPLMGRVTLSLETGGTTGYTDYTGSGLDFIWRGSGEFFFETFTDHLVGLRVYGGTGTINGKDAGKTPIDFKTEIGFFGAGIIYGYWASEKFLPIIFAGISNLSFDPKYINGDPLPRNAAGEYNKSEVNLNAELGLRYFITDEFALTLSGGVSINFNDNLDDIERGNNNDLFGAAYFGLTYTINANRDDDNDGVPDDEDMCLDTPAGVKVDAFGCPIDTDRDGVPDYLDQCPNTPARVRVDQIGCPLDTDKDGVPDYADRCPNTPPKVRVSRNGCPLDTDGDGVPDYWDRCANTPRGVRVDSLGCPFDSDRDGVPDYADRCPNTPKGIMVNNFGCPLDTDGDGVPDYLDKCPNTAPGTKITLDGCSDDFQEYIFDASTLYNLSESIITPTAYAELDKVVSRIKLRPNSQWRIEGHTDNKGESGFNKILSLQRAQAVYNYFISKGLDKTKFEVVGLGEDFPIADNNTEEGRTLNRRVVLIRIE